MFDLSIMSQSPLESCYGLSTRSYQATHKYLCGVLLTCHTTLVHMGRYACEVIFAGHATILFVTSFHLTLS